MDYVDYFSFDMFWVGIVAFVVASIKSNNYVIVVV